MVFSNHSGNFAYNAFSDQIRFTEAPEIGSEFVGYYIGKMRQLDDISFEFDSLRSSFNLRYLGIYYSLTLTEGVSSNVIRPENNIIVSLNGVVQELAFHMRSLALESSSLKCLRRRHIRGILLHWI